MSGGHQVMRSGFPSRPAVSAAAWLLLAGTTGHAWAGGYDTGERDWDFLFQNRTAAVESQGRTIQPDRQIYGINGTLGPSMDVKEAEAFSVVRHSATLSLGENIRCMASYREPWGGHADYGAAWTYSFSAIEQHMSSEDYGLTCALGAALERGVLSFVGGYSFQKLEYQLIQNGGLGGLRTTSVDDWSQGWRAGLAYEIPEYALRASLIYNSQMDFDMRGAVSLANVPGSVDVFGSLSMPQSVEAKFQSGVAPGWLAFASVKWTDWSVAQNMPLCAAGTPVCNQAAAVSGLALFFRDTWTVTAGAAHQLTDWLTLAGSITWDQGATQGFTSQTDVWTAGLTAIIGGGERVEIKLGGTAGIMAGGSLSTLTLADGIPNPVGYTASFGDDFVYTLSASAALRF